jgi:hypothetical protein
MPLPEAEEPDAPELSELDEPPEDCARAVPAAAARVNAMMVFFMIISWLGMVC